MGLSERGVDQTASAPKSVSVMWAVGHPEEREAVERAHDTAVSTLVGYMHRRCPLVRDHGEPQLARDVLAVAVNHHTSRHTEEKATRGTAPNPQLHTHVLWLLAERQDGRLCAIYRDQIWKNRVEWEAAYRCALATDLARAGFPIDRMTGKGRRYFEIAGIPESLRKRWSGRSIEVTEGMEEAAERFRTRYGREPTPASSTSAGDSYDGQRLFPELLGTLSLLVLVAVGGGMGSDLFGGNTVPYTAKVVALGS